MNTGIYSIPEEVISRHIIPKISITETVSLARTCKYYKKIIIDSHNGLWLRKISLKESDEFKIYRLIDGFKTFVNKLQKIEDLVYDNPLIDRNYYIYHIIPILNQSLNAFSTFNLKTSFESKTYNEDINHLKALIGQLGFFENEIAGNKVKLFFCFLVQFVADLSSLNFIGLLLLSLTTIYSFFKDIWHPKFELFPSLFCIALSIFATNFMQEKRAKFLEDVPTINPKLFHYTNLTCKLSIAAIYTILFLSSYYSYQEDLARNIIVWIFTLSFLVLICLIPES